MSDTDLRGKVAVVTGGATGIGLAASLAFARCGAAVAVNYSRNAEAADAAVKEIGRLGVAALNRKSTRLNLQSRFDLVCRLLLEKKKIGVRRTITEKRFVELTASKARDEDFRINANRDGAGTFGGVFWHQFASIALPDGNAGGH